MSLGLEAKEIQKPNWLMILRQIYLTYTIVLSGILMTISGFSVVLQVFYQFRKLEYNHTMDSSRKLYTQVAFIAQLMFGIFIYSNVLSKAYQIGKLIWFQDQYEEFANKIMSFFCCGKMKSRIFAIIVQITFVCALEVIPLLLGVIIAISTSDIAMGFQYWISSGTLVSFVTIITWWVASILTNHQRFIMMVILGKNIFLYESDEIEDHEYELINANMWVDPKTEMNFFSLAAYYIWEFPLIPKRCFSGRVRFRMKHVWKFLISFIVFSLIIGIGFLRFYVGMGFIISVYLFVIINSLLDSFFYIPNHSPSKTRLRNAWDVSFVQRFIAILEEGFYQSPFVVYHFAKFGLLATFILQGISIALGLFGLFGVLFLPLAIFSTLLFLYILRFNITRIVDSLKNLVSKVESSNPNEEKTEASSLLTPIPDENEIQTQLDLEKVNVEKDDLESQANSTDDILDQTTSYLHLESENHVLRIASVAYFSMILITVSSIVILWYFLFMGPVHGFAALAAGFTFSFFLFKRYDKDTVKVQSLFFLLLLSMMILIFVLGNYQQTESEPYPTAGTGKIIPPDTHPYLVCEKKWDGFGVLDFGFLSHLAYSSDPYFTKDLHTFFPNCTGCHVTHRYNETVSFYDFHIPEKNLSIIAVRGTHLFLDVIQDFDIWKEISLLQFASMLGPFLNFWPDSMTSRLIQVVSFAEQTAVVASSGSRFYYQDLDDYVRVEKTKRKIILTGHSLGGGIANIVGANREIQTIAFSAPGTIFNRHKLNIDLININRYCVNIIPDNDIVPKIDRNGGTIQSLDCDESFIACHSISRTVNRLTQSCGSGELGRFIKSN
eukprot:gene6116-10123_t